MIKVEEYKEENNVQPQITCLSCGTNKHPTSYMISMFNHLGQWKIPLCKECLDRVKVELEFLEAKEEEDEDN